MKKSKKTKNNFLKLTDASERKNSLLVRTGVRAGAPPAIEGNTGGGSGPAGGGG